MDNQTGEMGTQYEPEQPVRASSGRRLKPSGEPVKFSSGDLYNIDENWVAYYRDNYFFYV